MSESNSAHKDHSLTTHTPLHNSDPPNQCKTEPFNISIQKLFYAALMRPHKRMRSNPKLPPLHRQPCKLVSMQVLRVMRPYNPHNTFNLLIDSQISKH